MIRAVTPAPAGLHAFYILAVTRLRSIRASCSHPGHLQAYNGSRQGFCHFAKSHYMRRGFCTLVLFIYYCGSWKVKMPFCFVSHFVYGKVYQRKKIIALTKIPQLKTGEPTLHTYTCHTESTITAQRKYVTHHYHRS